MPAQTVDQLRDDRVPSVAIVEIAGGCISGLLALLAMTRLGGSVAAAAAAITLGAALLPHGIAIIARWHAVGNGGDQGLVRGGALIQLAAGVCALVLGIAAFSDPSLGTLRLAAIVVSGALLVGGPAHTLVGPAIPSTLLFGPTYKSALLTLVVATSAFFVAVYSTVVPHSLATLNLALLFSSIALVIAGTARRERRD